MSNILKRLEALEAARNGGSLSPAVSLLELGNDGLWELSCGLWDGKKDSRTERSTIIQRRRPETPMMYFLKTIGAGNWNRCLSSTIYEKAQKAALKKG